MRKIKYIGNNAQDAVIVDTMETARASGPGVVKRLFQLWSHPEAPWSELYITFRLGGVSGQEGVVRFKGSSHFFYWKVRLSNGKYYVYIRLYPSEPWVKSEEPLDCKTPPKKVLIKDILETLI